MVKNTAAAIDRARAALADTEAKITDITAKRAARLLAGDTPAAIGKLDGELDALRHAAATERDRIALLEEEAEKEAAERRAREKSALIERAEAKHASLAAAAAELQGHLIAADASFRKMLKIAAELRACWNWKSHQLAPCLIADNAILAALQHEIYRTGSRPLLLGGQDRPGAASLDFPGGKCPKLEWRGVPEKIPQLVEIARESARLASEIMRTGKSTGVVTVQPVNGEPAPRQRTAAEERLAELHKRQAELAADPATDDQVYENCISEIAVAAAAVDAERRSMT